MLRISVLGELRIEVDGVSVAPPDSRRARLLLGWLALHPGMHARTELAARLRPDVLDESARSSLRQAAWALRPVLGDALEADRSRIGLGDGAWIDVREFERLVEAGEGQEALALVQGPLLAGLDDDWVLDARYAQRQAEDALLERIEEEAAARGDSGAAVGLARRRMELDPLSEEAGRALMTRQAQAGDRAAALVTYGRLAERLRRELSVAPSAATRALATQLREEDEPPAAAPAAPAAPPVGPAAPAAARPLPPRLAAAARAPFVGRDHELTRVLDTWRQSRDGALRTVLLGGEPGIGKTRLAAELAARAADDGAAVIHGRCTEEQLAPYQAWVEALDQAGIAFDPAGEGARLALFRSVTEALTSRAKHQRLVVVLDDLHWADQPTLLLLMHVIGVAPAAPLLVLGTYRDTEAGAPLQRTLADLHREPGVERVRLRGLGDREVAALVDTLAQRRGGDSEFDRAVSEDTGGSPFFVRELVRHLEETGRPLAATSLMEAGLPEGVGEVLDRRLDRLDESARDALTVAAVAGLEFRTDVVAAAASIDERRLGQLLDDAVSAGLAVEPPTAPARYAFPHALVREALYRRVGAARRAALHADVARAIGRLSPDPGAADAAALAHHFAAAGLPDESLTHGEAAARAALEMLAWEDAAEHVERALAVASQVRVDPERRARLLLLIGEARGRAGAGEQASAAFAEVAALARKLGSGEMLARAALGAGGVGVTIVDVDTRLVGLLEEALAAVGDERPDLRARLLARLSTELYYESDEGRDRGRLLTADALTTARETDDPVTLTESLAARRVALWDPRHLDERLRVDAELIALGANHREAELRGRHWRFVDLTEAGEMDEARAELDRYEALASELRMPAFSWYAPLWRASLAIFEGRFEEGARLSAQACDAGRLAEDANADIFRVVQEGAILIDQERFPEFGIPDKVYERLESSASVAWMTGLAWAFSTLGREDEAAALMDELCADELARLPWDANRLACLAELAEAACGLGAVEHGAAVERALEPWAERNLGNARAISFYGSAHHFLGKLAELRGDLATAASRFEAAAARNASYGAPVRAALSRRELDRLARSIL